MRQMCAFGLLERNARVADMISASFACRDPHGKPGILATRNDLSHEYRRYLLAGSYHDRLIACAPLLSDDGFEWVGTATMAEVADSASVEVLPPQGGPELAARGTMVAAWEVCVCRVAGP
jgi:hypothetical protein